MRSTRNRAALAAAGLIVPLLTATGTAYGAGQGVTHRAVHVCATPAAGTAACDAILNETVTADGRVAPAASSPSTTAYAPTDLISAYNLAATSGAGRTVAVVDAYNDPNAEADLGTYRTQYGLPACTTTGGCFKKMSQTGSTTSFPKANGGWAQEISLDLDMVSAICPSCHVLLVEAASASNTDLAAAVNTAAKQPGVVAISNSYGGADSSSDQSYDSAYNHSGIAVTASAGDSGYGAQFPATSKYVTAVGGTHLVRDSSSRGWTETAWTSSGSGCSSWEPAQSWESAGALAACSTRGEADVSAVADPATGVNVYDSYTYQGQSGWLVFGGTSVSSPIIASVYALAGDYAARGGTGGSVPDSSASAAYLHDVTSGSNGTCGTVVCNAGPGWDGPTGNGTPNGVGAF